ncbi:MAG: hypothetical protein IPM95_12575 [Sphingobacteriales bacterium]|nr:hypothetical protein [Sphingobacteriales bacterium]
MKSYSLLLMLGQDFIHYSNGCTSKKPAKYRRRKVDGQRAICEGATNHGVFAAEKQGDKDFS